MILLNALLTPQIGLMFWNLLVFLLLLVVLRKFAWKPIMQMLKKREEGIEEALHQAEKARAEVKELVAKNVELIIEGQQERDAIIKEARDKSEQIIIEAKEEAKKESKRIMTEAQEMIRREREDTIRQIKSDVSDIILETAKTIISKELSSQKDHEQLIEKQISKIA